MTALVVEQPTSPFTPRLLALVAPWRNGNDELVPDVVVCQDIIHCPLRNP